MRSYAFYLAVALLAFGIGLFVGFKFYWSNGQSQKVEETVKTETNIQKETFVEDGYSNLLADKDKPKSLCVKAKQDDSQPWIHNLEVLNSFPQDNPLPRYLGAFRDKDWNYQLILYQDAKGVFGNLLSPVLDADSPTSVIYDTTFDSQSGMLKFSAKVQGGKLQFNGILRGRKIKAAIMQHNFNEKVILKRIRWYDDEDDEVSYKSRAEFDCATFLFGRY